MNDNAPYNSLKKDAALWFGASKPSLTGSSMKSR